MSHAVLLDTLDTGALWFVARGPARREADYKAPPCGMRRVATQRPRRQRRPLASFTAFLLEVCLDQVQFMESLVEPARLRERIVRWAAEESRQGALPAQADSCWKRCYSEGSLDAATWPRG